MNGADRRRQCRDVTAVDDEPVTAPPGRTDDVPSLRRRVLGSMIASRRAAEDLLDILGGEDCFGGAMHRAVYAAVRWLTEDSPQRTRHADNRRRRRRRCGAAPVRRDPRPPRRHRAGRVAHRAGRGDPRRVPPGTQPRLPGCRRGGAARRAAAAHLVALDGRDAGGSPARLRRRRARRHDPRACSRTPSAVPVQASAAVTAAELFTVAAGAAGGTGRPPGVIQFPWADAARPRAVPAARPARHHAARRRSASRRWPQTSPGTPACAGRSRASCSPLEQDRDEVMDRLIAAEAGRPARAHHRLHTGRRRLGPDRRARDRFAEASSSSTTRRRSPSRTSGRGCAAWPAASPRNSRSSTTCS